MSNLPAFVLKETDFIPFIRRAKSALRFLLNIIINFLSFKLRLIGSKSKTDLVVIFAINMLFYFPFKITLRASLFSGRRSTRFLMLLLLFLFTCLLVSLFHNFLRFLSLLKLERWVPFSLAELGFWHLLILGVQQ